MHSQTIRFMPFTISIHKFGVPTHCSFLCLPPSIGTFLAHALLYIPSLPSLGSPSPAGWRHHPLHVSVSRPPRLLIIGHVLACQLHCAQGDGRSRSSPPPPPARLSG